MKLFETIYSTVYNKCPRCHQGDVFVSKSPYDLKKMFSMHSNCSHCDLKYSKEQSFFYGAMYASYGLTVGWFIMWYALQIFVLDWPLMNFAVFIAITILLLSPVSLRWSRLLWLNLFFGYKKEYKNKK